MGEGSTGCCRALLGGKAFGRDGILWTLFSLSDSVPLKDLSGSAEATGAGRGKRSLLETTNCGGTTADG